MSALINKAFDDLVFENRNKTFGAFFMRQVYSKYITTATVISLSAFTLAISAPLIIKNLFAKEVVVEETRIVEVKLEDLVTVESNTPPPPPPPKIEMPKISSVKFLPPVVTPDEEVAEEDIMPTMEELENSNPGSVTQEGNMFLSDIIAVEAEPEIIEEKKEEEVYTYVAEMPQFAGGDQMLMQFLSDRLRYPKEAQKLLIEGAVWIGFHINKDGSLTDFQVLKSLGHGCDEEALRVVRQMPAWKPAYHNGKPVKYFKKIKVDFKLQH